MATLTLYERNRHAHVPQNVNQVQQEKKRGFFTVIADWAGTTQCIMLFCMIGSGSIIGIATGNVLLAGVCGAVSSYFIQLVFLPIIQRRSNELNKWSERQADEQYQTTLHILHDVEEIHNHEDEQDKELIRQSEMIGSLQAQLAGTLLVNQSMLAEVQSLKKQISDRDETITNILVEIYAKIPVANRPQPKNRFNPLSLLASQKGGKRGNNHQ